MKNSLKLLAAVGLTVFLVACGGNGDGGGDAGGPTALNMIDNAFQPSTLSVAAGAELDLSNTGAALHNLTIEGTDVNEDVEAGQSTTLTVDVEAGEYTMFCEYHRAAGMEGTITVQ
jgi:plastocyanin